MAAYTMVLSEVEVVKLKMLLAEVGKAEVASEVAEGCADVVGVVTSVGGTVGLLVGAVVGGVVTTVGGWVGGLVGGEGALAAGEGRVGEPHAFGGGETHAFGGGYSVKRCAESRDGAPITGVLSGPTPT